MPIARLQSPRGNRRTPIPHDLRHHLPDALNSLRHLQITARISDLARQLTQGGKPAMMPQHRQPEGPDTSLAHSQKRPSGLVINAPPPGIHHRPTGSLSPYKPVLPWARALADVMHKPDVTGQVSNPEYCREPASQLSGVSQVIFQRMPVTCRVRTMRP